MVFKFELNGIVSKLTWFLFCVAELSGEMCQADTEQWFFFAPRQEREARGGRPSRTTDSGYWKATGSPGYVYSSDNRVIGVKKTMVFYKGKAPTGRKTKWKMNEYRAIEEVPSSSSTVVPKVHMQCWSSFVFFFFYNGPRGTTTHWVVAYCNSCIWHSLTWV